MVKGDVRGKNGFLLVLRWVIIKVNVYWFNNIVKIIENINV